MKKLVIINDQQFGYHIDTLKYSEYLSSTFNIVYICWDQGKKKVKNNDVAIVYVSRKGNIAIRSIRYILLALKNIDNNDECIVFFKYLKVLGTIIRLCKSKTKSILDIRTNYISDSNVKRYIMDKFLLLESKFYKNITVISPLVANKVGVKKYDLLPLGGECCDSRSALDTCGLSLIYTGTFYQRDIYKTVIGLHQFLLKREDKISVRYDIFGSGNATDIAKIEQTIEKLKLENIVFLHGYKPNSEVLEHMNKYSNVGVSFIPITSFFTYQPPTKTFEYLLSGIPVLGTKTVANEQVINDKNGVLVIDTPDQFASGLEKIFSSMKSYDPNEIRNSVSNHSWSTICTELAIYFKKIK